MLLQGLMFIQGWLPYQDPLGLSQGSTALHMYPDLQTSRDKQNLSKDLWVVKFLNCSVKSLTRLLVCWFSPTNVRTAQANHNVGLPGCLLLISLLVLTTPLDMGFPHYTPSQLPLAALTAFPAFSGGTSLSWSWIRVATPDRLLFPKLH